MFSLVQKIKDIKTLALTHLQHLRDESRLSLNNDDKILKNCSSLLNNDVFLLTAATHLVKQLEVQKQEHQKFYSEVLQQIQSLQDQQRTNLERPKVISINQTPLHPEVGLMAYLYTYLPSRNALDIGAHTGEVTRELLQAGYEVYAFEPSSLAFNQLKGNIGERADFHPFEVAIGVADGTINRALTDLSESRREHLNYSSNSSNSSPTLVNASAINTVPLKVRSLESMRQSQEIPMDLGLIKIDIDGFALEVIRELGRLKHPVVVMKFGNEQPHLQDEKTHEPSVLLEQVVQEMRQRDYHWHIVICSDFETREFFFYCNDSRMPKWEWGSVLFFQSYNLFTQALKWCSSVLRPAYFVS